MKLHSAETACTSRLQRLMVAEGRNLDTMFFSNLKDGLSFLPLDFFTVELKSYHKSYNSFGIFNYMMTMASNLQAS
jgi:hypothetical protein